MLALKKSSGFTLIEILVTISIVAVISAIGITTYTESQKLARDAKRKQDIRAISAALEIYYQKHKQYPQTNTTDHPSMWAYSKSSGANWIIDRTNSVPLSPEFIDKLPKDPVSNDNAYAPANQGYFYYSSGNLGSTCKTGQYYLLLTKLENPNDRDNTTNNPVTVCGNTGTTAAYSPNGYMIVRQ